MIKGIHAMFYSPKAEQLREFLRDVVGFQHTDTGDGWLIFDAPEADMGCHPSDRSFHEISFYCDDIESTVAELRSRGVEFTGDVTDAGWGLVTRFELPDGTEVDLYQPKYTRDGAAR